jgi:hypothetical protein
MAADTVSVLATVDDMQPRFCLPTNIVMGTAVDVAVKWMEDNPAKLTFLQQLSSP